MGWANDWVAYASAKSHFLTGSDDQRGTTGVVFVQIAPGIHQKSILSFLVGDDHQRLALLQVEEENRLKEKVASAFDERRKKTGLKIVDFEESATWKQSLLSRHHGRPPRRPPPPPAAEHHRREGERRQELPHGPHGPHAPPDDALGASAAWNEGESFLVQTAPGSQDR